MDNVSDWTLRKNVLCLRYAARNFAIVTSPMCVSEDEAGWKLEWDIADFGSEVLRVCYFSLFGLQMCVELCVKLFWSFRV